MFRGEGCSPDLCSVFAGDGAQPVLVAEILSCAPILFSVYFTSNCACVGGFVPFCVWMLSASPQSGTRTLVAAGWQLCAA